MLFKPEHIPMIIKGTKTQTRRPSCHVKVGNTYQVKTKMITQEYFARIRVKRIWWEPLGEITDADAKAEGYPTRETYFAKYAEIYKLKPAQLAEELAKRVCCIEFECIFHAYEKPFLLEDELQFIGKRRDSYCRDKPYELWKQYWVGEDNYNPKGVKHPLYV